MQRQLKMLYPITKLHPGMQVGMAVAESALKYLASCYAHFNVSTVKFQHSSLTSLQHMEHHAYFTDTDITDRIKALTVLYEDPFCSSFQANFTQSLCQSAPGGAELWA